MKYFFISFIVSFLVSYLIYRFVSGNNKKPILANRYFHIGYVCQNGSAYSTGTFERISKEIPTLLELRASVYESVKCDGFKNQQCVIVSFYEFRDSAEASLFYRGGPSFPMVKCDTPAIIHYIQIGHDALKKYKPLKSGDTISIPYRAGGYPIKIYQ